MRNMQTCCASLACSWAAKLPANRCIAPVFGTCVRTCVRGVSSSIEWKKRQVRDPYVQAAALSGYRSRAAFKLLELNERFRFLRPGDSVVDLGAAPGGWSQVAAKCVRARRAGVSQVGMPGSSVGSPRAKIDNTEGNADENVTRRATRRSVLEGFADEPVLRSGGVGSHANAANNGGSDVAGATQAHVGDGGKVVAVDLLSMPPVSGVAFIRGDFLQLDVQKQVQNVLPSRVADVVISDMSHSFTGDSHTDHVRQMTLAWCAFSFACRVLKRRGHFVVKVRYGEEYEDFRAAIKRRFVRMVEIKPPASRAESSEAYILGFDMRSALQTNARSTQGMTPSETAAVHRLGIPWPE